MKLPKILFFVKGPFPSDEDKAFAKASEKQALTVFRNALAVPTENHSLEICDGVAGAVPAIYAKKFPKAEKAIAAYKETLKNISEKVGDVPAPNRITKTESEKALEASILRNAKNPDLKSSVPPATGKPPAWNPNPNPPA
jgi:hypothetical protein